MTVQRAISTFDLFCCNSAKQAVLSEDKKELEKILYSLGLDVKEPYSIESVLHRPLMKKDNEPWFGPRYVGNERQDEAYLKSGSSTWENLIDSSRDPELRAELQKIGRTGSSDLTFVDEQVGKKVAQREKQKGY